MCPCLGCCVLAAGSAETGRPGALRISGNEQPSAARLDGAFVGTHKHTNKAGTHTNTHICLHDHARILSLFVSHLLSHTHIFNKFSVLLPPGGGGCSWEAGELTEKEC